MSSINTKLVVTIELYKDEDRQADIAQIKQKLNDLETVFNKMDQLVKYATSEMYESLKRGLQETLQEVKDSPAVLILELDTAAGEPTPKEEIDIERTDAIISEIVRMEKRYNKMQPQSKASVSRRHEANIEMLKIQLAKALFDIKFH